jgi:hypothetical protein
MKTLTKESIIQLWEDYFYSRSPFYWLDFSEALLEALEENLDEDTLSDLWHHHCLTRLTPYVFADRQDNARGSEFAQDIIDYLKAHCHHPAQS